MDCSGFVDIIDVRGGTGFRIEFGVGYRHRRGFIGDRIKIREDAAVLRSVVSFRSDANLRDMRPVQQHGGYTAVCMNTKAAKLKDMKKSRVIISIIERTRSSIQDYCNLQRRGSAARQVPRWTWPVRTQNEHDGEVLVRCNTCLNVIGCMNF